MAGNGVAPDAGAKALAVAEKRFTIASDAVLREHRIAGAPILPGVAYLEMALATTRLHLGRPVWSLEDVVILRPLGVNAAGEARARVVLDRHPDPERLRVTVLGWSEAEQRW